MGDNGIMENSASVEDLVKEALNSTEESEEPITVDSWRANTATLLVLPSGQRVKAKPLTLFELVVAGKIPDTLVAVALSAINQIEKNEPFDKTQLLEHEEMINICVINAVVEPPVAEVPDTKQLGIREISWLDRTYIFDWSNGAAKSLNSFRKK